MCESALKKKQNKNTSTCSEYNALQFQVLYLRCGCVKECLYKLSNLSFLVVQVRIMNVFISSSFTHYASKLKFNRALGDDNIENLGDLFEKE